MKFVIVEYATFHHVVIMHNLKDMEVEHSFHCNMMICNVTRVFLLLFLLYIYLYFLFFIFISIIFSNFLMSYLNNRRVDNTTDLLTK